MDERKEYWINLFIKKCVSLNNHEEQIKFFMGAMRSILYRLKTLESKLAVFNITKSPIKTELHSLTIFGLFKVN